MKIIRVLVYEGTEEELLDHFQNRYVRGSFTGFAVNITERFVLDEQARKLLGCCPAFEELVKEAVKDLSTPPTFQQKHLAERLRYIRAHHTVSEKEFSDVLEQAAFQLDKGSL